MTQRTAEQERAAIVDALTDDILRLLVDIHTHEAEVKDAGQVFATLAAYAGVRDAIARGDHIKGGE